MAQPAGIDDPGSIDEVRVPGRGDVELVICHDGTWDGSEQRQILLQEKVNRYLEHVVDGELAHEHPAARGRRWVVVVETAVAPDARTQDYLRAADRELRGVGGGVRWRVAQPPRQ